MNFIFFNSKSKFAKIVYTILVSFILLIAFDRIFYVGYRYAAAGFYSRPPKNSIHMKVHKKEKEFYDTLIMGTSRTKQGIHPWYLNKYLNLKAYKIADSGKYPRYNFQYYKIFRKKYKIPKYVFYGVDYFMFEKTSNLRRMRTLLGFKIKRSRRSKFSFNLKIFNPLQGISLTLKEKEKINGFIIDYLDNNAKQQKRKNGKSLISTRRGSKKTAPPQSIIEPPHWEKIKYTNYPGLEGNFLNMLFDDLKKDKVKVFVVILPDIISVYKTNYEYKKFENDIKTITEKYKNITLLNYNSLKKFDLKNPILFRDGSYGSKVSHLSYYGAEILNKILCKDIKSKL